MAAAIGEAAGIHKAVRIMNGSRPAALRSGPPARAPPKWTAPGVRCVCAGRGLPTVGFAVSVRGVRLPVVRLFCPLVENFAVMVLCRSVSALSVVLCNHFFM